MDEKFMEYRQEPSPLFVMTTCSCIATTAVSAIRKEDSD
jgi:hypothetical protein